MSCDKVKAQTENTIEYYKNTENIEEIPIDILRAMYKDVLEELKNLKWENRKLKLLREDYGSHFENTRFITENDIIKIEKNKWLLEINDGVFVDVKDLYFNSLSKIAVKKALEDIEDYFYELNGPDEDLGYIRKVKQELLETQGG